VRCFKSTEKMKECISMSHLCGGEKRNSIIKQLTGQLYFFLLLGIKHM
jgi:hypothetical protein